MAITPAEIAETRGMVEEQNLDIRTITMGVSLMGCGDENLDRMCTKIYDHVTHTAEHLVETAENLEREYGIPIVNKRVSVTPVAQIAACCKDEDLTPIAHALDRAAETLGIDYLGGFSALVQKGIGDADRRVIQSIPQALATTSRVCSSVNVASLRAGINMDAVLMAAQTIIDAAKLTADQDSVGASKFVCFANMVEDSPFMAGAVHGGGEADAVINVGVSGPGVMAAALETLPDSASMMEVAEKIKQTAFKITRAGELMSREAAHRLGVEKGIVDLSLAPTPAIGDSVARILEIIGVGTCGGPGTTCALAMLNDAVKKGGVMASSSVGGLSGAFIPVSEDAGMIAAVEAGALSLEKLEAMTCVCSVGLDMIAIPGDTPVETIAGIIADEMAIGVINNKTTAVRVIPAIGKGVGDFAGVGRSAALRYLAAQSICPFCDARFLDAFDDGGRLLEHLFFVHGIKGLLDAFVEQGRNRRNLAKCILVFGKAYQDERTAVLAREMLLYDLGRIAEVLYRFLLDDLALVAIAVIARSVASVGPTEAEQRVVEIIEHFTEARFDAFGHFELFDGMEIAFVQREIICRQCDQVVVRPELKVSDERFDVVAVGD